jgi:hypothetical protein
MSAGRREIPNGRCCRWAPDLHVSADGKSAEFSTLDATSLALIVSVAGDGKQIAHDHIQVEVLDIHVPEPPRKSFSRKSFSMPQGPWVRQLRPRSTK